MAKNVGGTSCAIVRSNAPPGLKQRVLTWFVPGTTGVGAHKLGSNDAEWEFQLVFFGTDAQCDTWATTISAMQATIVDIEDDHGDTYSDMLIEKVSNPRKTAAAWSAGVVTDKRSEITITGKMSTS